MTLPLLLPDWPAPANVRAAMTTRNGGVSAGAHASLNLGSRTDDESGNVAENRRRLAAELKLPAEPAWLRQVHGRTVVDARTVKPDTEADASFTTGRGEVCVVMAADCLPVLFCNDAGSMVAAAHAGWRGLAAGVLEATVAALPAPAGSLMAWLGAAIGPDAFEVGPEVREVFCKADPGAADQFRPQAQGKFMADLWGLARRRLAACGVNRVFGGGRCTSSEPEHFFSYRRDGACGRMAALIWLAALPQEMRGSG